MSKYRLIVFTDAVAGREDEFNDWYTNRHIGDVVAVPGVASAQRFELKSIFGGEFRHRYLAIYEIDAEDYEAAVREILNRANTDAMPLSDALESSIAFAVFQECSPLVRR
jgi:hypothetical protein